MKKSYYKWIVLVSANTVLSLVLALEFMKTPQRALGVIFGIISFIILYAKLEDYLIKTGRMKWRKALIIGVGATAILLLFPGFPMISGALALDLSGSILDLSGSGRNHISFFSIYLTTIIDGLLLSSLVIVLTIFARLLFNLEFLKKNDK